MRLTSLLPLLELPGVAPAAVNPFQTRCNSFQNRIDITNVTVRSVEYVAAGQNISQAEVAAACKASLQASIDFCRVTMNISTSDRSHLWAEAWLPRNYTGRFMSTGNGGLAGCVQETDLNFAATFGFATIGTNAGHDGDTAEPFFHNSEVLADFAYRSVHAGTVVGKELTQLFYPEGFNYSYYLGCSTGGRQGYQQVQRFPEDYDGVVAGSAAMNFINLISWGAFLFEATGAVGDPGYISADLWAVVHDEILRQCDAVDGALDGIIEDPDFCAPVLETLICDQATSDTSSCLTPLQASRATRALGDFYGPDGQLYYPRLEYGAEADAADIYFTGSMFDRTVGWYRYVVYNDTTWNSSQWTLESAKLALEQNPFNIEAFDPDITTFRDRGSKLLSYHGTQDPVISSGNSKLYYRRVAKALSARPSDLDEFYRLFQISGMGHCGDGDGASYIGQAAGTYTAQAPQVNLLRTIVEWVEQGKAPEFMAGNKLDASGNIEYLRKHCRYPQHNIHTGPGNYTDPDAWTCV
ncbi:Feruloyl esterase B [Aspergillus heteromorphus CBS 117.55]|uniref:Carboxylic ester hydrolase n=1 Tax=Aspergillus heteromorphus CBS 117.55 TaxID=1448321 RepID=A0A317W9S6_9EURO|nr:Feruloyl esterase B [Aspergillus heteromorphus CBS 117.55]PWY83344.1 Feruloyl esterase B [Aspergillus heteromorphus CBS 117.55]